ncbi:MAG: ABC transporter permease, partial [Anaerolineales bacterium]|nr:ABC transporter permease [Anaerolineales bacterium]
MRPIELLRLVKNNLLRMRIRVLMTSAGVFIGTTAVILLVSLGAGLQRAIVSSFGDVADLTEIQVSPPGIAFFGPTAVNTQSSSDLIINDRTIS